MSAWMEMATGGHYNASSNQAWRDNFNGGWAAGDWTGNHNAQIASDRADAGERNPEVLSYLPADYRLNPNPASPNPNRGGSGDQGASPSQSGKPGTGGPVVPKDPQVAKAGGKFTPSGFGVGQISGAPGYWIDKIKTDYATLLGGGKNKQPMAGKPLEHEQAIVGGHNIVHDTGFSSVEVFETTYGEGDGLLPGPTSVYQWVKFAADMSETLAANGYPRLEQGVDWLTRVPNEVGKAVNRAGVDWLQQNVPMVESDPLPRNPYGGNSPWSQPFQ